MSPNLPFASVTPAKPEADVASAVTPYANDPSLVIQGVQSPETDAYLASHCPELATSGVGDSLADQFVQLHRLAGQGHLPRPGFGQQRQAVHHAGEALHLVQAGLSALALAGGEGFVGEPILKFAVHDRQRRFQLVRRSLVKAPTTAANAAPMTTPTAMSTTLPRRMNCLKPLSMIAPWELNKCSDRAVAGRDLNGYRSTMVILPPASASLEHGRHKHLTALQSLVRRKYGKFVSEITEQY